ncbi:MAG TPA: hypothetical protein VIM63_03720 [Rhodoferax sp.]
MSQTYGMESPQEHIKVAHRMPVRYVLVIDGADSKVARLFLASREMVAEMDASVEEVNSMIAGMTPVVGAMGSEWDAALAGHREDERAAAEIYTLAI